MPIRRTITRESAHLGPIPVHREIGPEADLNTTANRIPEKNNRSTSAAIHSVTTSAVNKLTNKRTVATRAANPRG